MPGLKGVGDKPFTSAGTLYVTDLQPGCVPLVIGSGSGSERIVRDQFRVRHVQASEEDIVAWTWEKNRYGARVFATSFGHLGDFAVPEGKIVPADSAGPGHAHSRSVGFIGRCSALAALPHSLGEHVVQGRGAFPAHAFVGNAQAVDEAFAPLRLGMRLIPVE